MQSCCHQKYQQPTWLERRWDTSSGMGLLEVHPLAALELVEANPGCLRALTQVVNHILKGQALLEVAPYFAGGNLCAIPPKLRPV